MNILILGSEGFIGSHLVSFYIQQGAKVCGCDLFPAPTQEYRYTQVSRMSPEWEQLFRARAYDVCINATGSASVPYSMDHPVLDFEANDLDTIRILDSMRRFNPSARYLHISSAAVYGNPQILPIAEGADKAPLSPYGWHKWIAEHICREYQTVFGLSVAIVRPFSVYGPGLKKQMFWDLYQRYKSGSRTIELLGTGAESRHYIYIADLVRAFDCVIRNGSFAGEAVNIAAHAPATIQQTAELFFRHLDPSVALTFNNVLRPGDPRHLEADTQVLSSLKFTPTVTMDQGTAELVRWLVTQ